MWRWVASCALVSGVLLAGTAPAWAATPPQGLTEPERIAIIRSLIAKVGIARLPLPPDKHGVEINPEGRVLNASDVQQALLDKGSAERRGGRVAITAITFKSDRIEFDINGGPHKTHWYDHLHFGMSGSTPTTTDPAAAQRGPHGALITLRFAHDVPALTPEQVQHFLSPLIDWDPPSKATVMVQPLPTVVKQAIQSHHVLVGMNRQMVVAAMGRTSNKSGSTDEQGRQVEDWVYGEPPETTFVRFYNQRVIRITVWHNGAETVSTQAPPELEQAIQRQQQRAAQAEQQSTEPAPTLRRPGDPAAPTLRPGAQSPIMLPPPSAPPAQPPGGQPPNTTQQPPVCCTRP